MIYINKLKQAVDCSYITDEIVMIVRNNKLIFPCRIFVISGSNKTSSYCFIASHIVF
ncbi:competence regulator inhibitor paratox [Streptococcus equi]|uniref:competence regulator inhibitor paratox n=1 Tax=Streptococcus equi TaxID=1336 RepID=UPI003F5124C9